MKERPKDDFQKKYLSDLTAHVDRWLLGSQWAGRWAESSNRTMAGYVKDLNLDAVSLETEADLDMAHLTLEKRLKLLVADVIADATKYIETLAVQTRERVSVYRNVLWVWHRIEKDRWKMSQIQLRTGRSKKASLDVDHTVAFARWSGIVTASGLIDNDSEQEDALAIVNHLGNCSLLEKVSTSRRVTKA